MSVTNFPTRWPQHPPSCQCGCQDNPCPPSPDFLACWEQIAMLKKIIAEIIGDMGGPVKTGPIKGVIDGSQANVGEVGEHIQSIGSAPFVASASTWQVINVSAGVVPPGDWHLYGALWSSTAFTEIGLYLDPKPTGFSNDMNVTIGQIGGAAGPETTEYAIISLQACQATISVPTLLAFRVAILTPNAGTFAIRVEGRRLR